MENVTLKECILEFKSNHLKTLSNGIYSDLSVINQNKRCRASVYRYREEIRKMEREEDSIRRAIKKVEVIRKKNLAKTKYKILDLFGLSNVSSNCSLVEIRLRIRLQKSLRKGLRLTNLILHNIRESLKLLKAGNYNLKKKPK